MPPVSPNSLTVSNPSHVSRPPTTGPVRILTLDGAPGGALRGLAQIKIVRALMKEVWKREHPNQDLVESEIDAMRPCDHFNMIFGSGTGGTIAVLLGRLNLTIKECEDHYKAIGDEVYANPFSNWNPRQRYNYDHERLERILKEESKPFASEAGVVRFGHQSERSPSCKAAVLTKMAHSIQSVHVLKSYEAEAGEVWEVIRATTASYYDFPNIKVNRLVLLGPDSGFNNPAEKAWNEAVRLYPQRVRGVWFISIGSGVHHENKLHPPVKEALPWENKLLAGMIRVRGALGAVRDNTARVLPQPVVGAVNATLQGIQTWSGYSWEFVWGMTPGRAAGLQEIAQDTTEIHMKLNDRLYRHDRTPEPQGFNYYRLNLRIRKEAFNIDAWKNRDELLKLTFSPKNPDLLSDAPLVKSITTASQLLTSPRDEARSRRVHILTVDGAPGCFSALIQLKVLRRLMKDLFKRLNQARTGLNQGRAATFSDTDIDNMRPCEYFDLIVGSGTGGLIAIYLGRLKLTIKECEERLVNIGDQVYEAPFSHWNVFQRYSYDSTALEKVLKEQPGSNLPFCHQEAEGTGCKVAVLVSTGLPGSTQILRSYRHAQTNTQQDTGVWQTMRATMASYHDFPPVETGTQVLWGPDASFSNPSQVAVGEAEDLFHLRRNVDLGEPAAPGRGLCIMSLGNGLYPESAPFASTPIEYQIQLSLRKLRGIVPSLWAAARGLLPEKVHALRDLAMGCEHQHREILAKFPKEADIGTRRDNLMLYFNSSQSKYFRFNIEDEMGELLDSRTWNDASKARVDEWASTEYLSEDFTPDRLNEWELACSQL